MPKAFRPSLEPPSHRRLNLENRRPWCCLILSSVVLAFLFAIFATSGWNLHYHQFELVNHGYNAGDQIGLRGVSKDFSTLFCHAYQVTLEDPGTVYLFSHLAVVNESETRTQTLDLNPHHDSHYRVRKFFLLQGSQLDIIGCHAKGSKAPPSELLFIKGNDHFRRWTHDKRCHECIEKTMTIPSDATCPDKATTDGDLNSNSNPSTFKISIAKTDQYVLVASYGHGDVRGDVINVTLTRTLYELSDPETNCTFTGMNNESCQFDLQWNSNADVVVDFSDDDDDDDDDDIQEEETRYDNKDTATRRNFHSRCKVRIYFWILIFAGIPMVLTIPIAFGFFWCLCRKRTKFGPAKRLSSTSEVKIRDDSCLVKNEVVHRPEEDTCMAIQDS